MPSLAAAAPDGAGHASFGANSHAAPFGPSALQNASNNPRPRSPRTSCPTSPFLKAHNRLCGKENQPAHHQHQQLQQDSSYSGRTSPSCSLANSITNGRTRTAPPTTDSSKKRDSQSGLPPPLTAEEFEALPVAIQRKYFSTLERLRFAQPSGGVDGIFNHYCENSRRRSPRQDRGVTDHFSSRIKRRSLRNSQSLDVDSITSANNLPDKIKKCQLTREEQVALAKKLRVSVILDAADEAVCRRTSRNFAYDVDKFASSSLDSPTSMDSFRCGAEVASQRHAHGRPQAPVQARSEVADSLYDSFRWLDDDEDLDLRLFLDDYHANLREALPLASTERQPSFRRHLSITNIPFGRPSVSSSRPATKDASTPTSPLHSPTSPPAHYPTPTTGRRRSRTMSLIHAKHASQDSSSPIDYAAAHYQDPEARLKLRVYLASPQKFDEAIEFGFPSAEALAASPVINKSSVAPPRRHSRQQHPVSTEGPRKVETFLVDGDDDDDDGEDKLSYSDQLSAPDPESPKTPLSTDKGAMRPARLPMLSSTEGYIQVPASSREMTLRMTLTRPDLRASEEQIYGWKQQPGQAVRKSQSNVLRDDVFPAVMVGGDAGSKESMERHFAGIDHWGPPQDRSVMKRIWNRVRRS